MNSLRRLWRIVEHDIPWAVSSWLLVSVVTPAVAGLRQAASEITARKIVYLAAFIIFAWAAAEWYFSADVAMLLVGDSALYIEIVTFTYLAIARGHMLRALSQATQMLRAALRRPGIVRVTAQAKRSLRLPQLFDDEDSGDVPDAAFA